MRNIIFFFLLFTTALSSGGLQAHPVERAERISARVFNIVDYGAVGDGKADDTAALQLAIDTAMGNNRRLLIPAGRYLCRGLSMTFSRGNLQSGVWLTGEGPRATRLIKTGPSQDPVLSATTTAPPTEAYLHLANCSIDGAGRAEGVRLTGLAHSTLSGLVVENCTRALDCYGSLVLLIDDCTLQRSETGARFRKEGIVHANAITFRNSKLNLNRGHGIDFGEGSLLRLRDCQLEANGTPGRRDSGAVILRAGLSEEYGYAMMVAEGCWFEGNRGWSFFVERNPGLYLSLRDSQILSSEDGRAAYIAAASCCLLDNVLLPSPSDVLDATCDKLTINAGLISKLAGTQKQRTFANATFG